jgi:hypothetical protein
LQAFDKLSGHPHPKPGACLAFGRKERLEHLAERVRIHHHDRNDGAFEQILQIVTKQVKCGIVTVQLIVEP